MRVPKVEIFRTGRHRPDSPAYTVADLDDIVANFERLRGQLDPPVVIGHEEEQPLTQGLAESDPFSNTGSPAVGWISRLWRQGRSLYADLEGVHPAIGDLVNRRAYRKVSAEVYDRDQPPEGLPVKGCVLRRLALLGGELPQIKTLADLPLAEPASHSATSAPCQCHLRRHGEQRLPGGVYAVFFEVSIMDRTGIEDQFREVGWTDDQITALASLSDEDLQKLLTATLAQAAGVTGEPEGPAGEPALMMEWPEGLDRDTAIAELVAMGEAAEALAALPDEDLWALYQERKGTTMADRVVTPPPRREADEEATAGGSRTGRHPSQVTYKFSEKDRRHVQLEIRRMVAQETAGFRREAKAVRIGERKRLAEEKRSRLQTFAERMLKEDRVTPAELEDTPRLPGLVRRLSFLPDAPVHRYSEGGKTVMLSALDLELRAIESRPARKYSEKVREGHGENSATSADRKKHLLSLTPTGRAALAQGKTGQN